MAWGFLRELHARKRSAARVLTLAGTIPSRSARWALPSLTPSSRCCNHLPTNPIATQRPTITIVHAKPLMLLSLMASNHNNSKNHCNNCSGYKQLKSQPIISLTAIPHKEAHHQ
jgi:hypothetical protein